MSKTLTMSALALAASASLFSAENAPFIQVAHDGGRLSFDGICYDYVDPIGQKGMTLWTPPTERPIRAVLLFGNPGSAGDTRPLCLNRSWQEWAVRQDFAIAGVTWFRGGEIYEKTGKDLLAAFNGWGAMGFHPELSQVPLMPRGSSNAGMTSYALTCLAPERIICFNSNVGARYSSPAMPSIAALQVPGMQHIGPEDPFMPLGLKTTAELYQRIRDHNPLWSWDAEQGKGHQIYNMIAMDMAFYNEVLPRRLPATITDRSTAPEIIPLKRDDGWLADTNTWEHREGCLIAPVASYSGDPRTAVWLPGPATARAYQGATTWRKSIQLRIEGLPPSIDPDGNWNIQGERPTVVDPGATITLAVHPYDPKNHGTIPDGKLPDWERLDFFDGDQLVASTEAGAEPRCTLTANGAVISHIFTVVAHLKDGRSLVANPAAVVVRDPALSDKLSEQMQSYLRVPLVARANDGADLSAGEASVEPANNRLIAYALSADDEASFATEDHRAAPFWARTPAVGSAVLRPADQGVGDARSDSDADLSMVFQAAYSRSGLYLFVTNRDDQRTRDGNRCDMLDFHISRIDPRHLAEGSVIDHYQRIDTNLLVEECQYVLPLAGSGSDPQSVRLMRNRQIGHAGQAMWLSAHDDSLAELAVEQGVIIRFVNVNNDFEGVEWFLPWSLVGRPGAWQQPAPGTHLALALGMNDVDGDVQHNLRWPYGLDAWVGVPLEGPRPTTWGSLVLGPPLP